jgi:hypothetical protein
MNKIIVIANWLNTDSSSFTCLLLPHVKLSASVLGAYVVNMAPYAISSEFDFGDS